MFACLHAPGNLDPLIECAAHFSPLIEETSADTVVFDIRGLRLIFGAPEHIAAEIQARIGLPANIAIASNPDAAVHAARGVEGITVIPEGKEATALAPLPLFLLGGSPEFAEALHVWGIRTFGEFAALPPSGVAARLGEEGARMQRLARGEGRRLLRLRGEPLSFQKTLEPETPVDLLEPLLFLVSNMLQEVCGRLRSHSLSANEVHLLLKLERTPDHAVVLRLPVPMLDAKVFLKLLQLELSQTPPRAAVDKIRLELKPVESRATQHGLFLPASPEPEKLEITLARIRGLVGAANVGAPEPLDTHRPDSFRMRAGQALACPAQAPPAGQAARDGSANRKACPTKLALRRFRPPCPAQVWCASDGRPVKISSTKATGRILTCGGPWRTSGDWWTGDPWDRMEWDIETAGALLRIHQDCKSLLWLIEGSYD
ncbi:MAG TPA: hypothetical protein VH639_25390 [Bryobacteraceae bacterium]|jgi:protein ImuB